MRAAAELEMETYLIGGFVRDKLLGRITKDADIVSAGDGIELAKAVARQFHPCTHRELFQEYFGTAHIKVNFADAVDASGDTTSEWRGARSRNLRHRICRCPKGKLPSSSRNPEVAPGTLEDDQNRRDFTINALAISLNKKDYGKLIDPFNGIKDLENRIIRTPLEPGTNIQR